MDFRANPKIYVKDLLADAGVVGDYGEARIIVRNSSSGIITGIKDENGTYTTDAQTLNITRGFGGQVVIVLAWTTQLLSVNVIPAEDNIQFDPEIGYGVVFSCLHLLRNVQDSGVQSYSPSLEMP
ncbi:unnamed protein product [Adineta ricciae]|uniref:Uncharacterized protein n=1 Tax=Adineta ricciae TaxID=249248 RepID=A0A815LBL0_ADIRI|nr:unnamed protein product [Adineta ricciae]